MLPRLQDVIIILLSKDTQPRIFSLCYKLLVVTLFRGTPPETPQKATALHGDKMEHKTTINHARKRKVREKRVEVKLSTEEYETLKNANTASIARFLRESALSAVNKEETQIPQFTKLDRDFLLELARIGNNINQIAKAINTDIAADRPIDAARLLHLLIGIDQTLKELKK